MRWSSLRSLRVVVAVVRYFVVGMKCIVRATPRVHSFDERVALCVSAGCNFAEVLLALLLLLLLLPQCCILAAQCDDRDLMALRTVA